MKTSEQKRQQNRAWKLRNPEKVREYTQRQNKRDRDLRALNPFIPSSFPEHDYEQPFKERFRSGHAVRDRLSDIRYHEYRTFIDGYKLEHGCIDCGYRAHACALDFDHRPGTHKSFGIAGSSSRNRDMIWAEIQKCDVRCRNCHAVVTKDRLV